MTIDPEVFSYITDGKQTMDTSHVVARCLMLIAHELHQLNATLKDVHNV